jgi:hypothetical protein
MQGSSPLRDSYPGRRSHTSNRPLNDGGAGLVVRVGTSGWSYDHWEDVLYPPGAPARERLGYYVRRFDTVELNSSFYRWPNPSRFAGWRDRLPDGFVMSVKAPRGLTHGKRLYAPEQWVNRIAVGWHELRDKRAVLLVQLPPQQVRDDARLAFFLDRLPWWLPVAVEFRHPSWVHDDVFDLLPSSSPRSPPNSTPAPARPSAGKHPPSSSPALPRRPAPRQEAEPEPPWRAPGGRRRIGTAPYCQNRCCGRHATAPPGTTTGSTGVPVYPGGGR